MKNIYELMELFAAVAESGSFEQAGEKLFLSATAVARQIHRLETILEVQLVERSNRGIVLTKAGEQFFQDCVSVGKLFGVAISETKAIAAKAEGNTRIRFGVSMINPAQLIKDELTSWREFADIQIVMMQVCEKVNCYYRNLQKLGREFDITAVPEGVHERFPDYEFLKVKRFPVKALMTKDNPLTEKEVLEPSDLVGKEVYCLSGTGNQNMDEINVSIARNLPGAHVHKFNLEDGRDLVQTLIGTDWLFCATDISENIGVGLVSRPINWNLGMNYGIMYSKFAPPRVLEMVNKIKEQMES